MGLRAVLGREGHGRDQLVSGLSDGDEHRQERCLGKRRSGRQARPRRREAAVLLAFPRLSAVLRLRDDLWHGRLRRRLRDIEE